MSWIWTVFVVIAAMGQTARNAMQRELTPALGALGATLVRFLFGFPFALIFLLLVLAWTGARLPAVNAAFAGWTLVGALTQIAADITGAVRDVAHVAVFDIGLVDAGALDGVLDGVRRDGHRRSDIESAAAGFREPRARV